MTREVRLVTLVTNLALTLQTEANNAVVSDQNSSEALQDTLLRLIGVETKITLSTGQEKSLSPDDSTAGGKNTLVAQLLSKRDDASLRLKANLHSVFVELKRQVIREVFTKNEIRKRRLKRILGNNSSLSANAYITGEIASTADKTPIESIVQDTNIALDQVRRNVEQQGLLEKQMYALQAVAGKVVATVIASKVGQGLYGPFEDTFSGLLNELSKDLTSDINALDRKRRGLSVELEKISNVQEDILTGFQVSGKERLSLLQVIDLMIFLTDDSLVQYQLNKSGKYMTQDKSDLVEASRKILAKSLEDARNKGRK